MKISKKAEKIIFGIIWTAIWAAASIAIFIKL